MASLHVIDDHKQAYTVYHVLNLALAHVFWVAKKSAPSHVSGANMFPDPLDSRTQPMAPQMETAF